ncbi:MAG: hypothetical protein ACYC9N_22315 [Thermoanaerobaculia bacterium]
MTTFVAIAKEALVVFRLTVTRDGTMTEGSSLVSATSLPPGSLDGRASVTVPVDEAPPAMNAGVAERLLT